MFSRAVRRLILTVLAILAYPAIGPAQGPKPSRGYVPIPFDGNLEDMLRRRFEELVKKNNIDPKLLPSLPDKTNWERMQELMKKIPAELSPEQKQKLKQQLDKALTKLSSPPKVSGSTFPPRKAKAADPPQENLETRFSRWAVDLMENAKNTTLGDMLRESSAWQEGIKDFERFLSGQASSGNFPDPGKWNLPFPKDLNIDLEQSWAKIKNLSLPQLPSVKIPMPDLSIGNPLSGLTLPSFSSGSVAMSQALVWVLVVLGLVLVVWQMVRRVGRTGLPIIAWRLGPWPVDPARISSRAELIVAFEHLALLCVGPQARTWNHCAIGEELGKDQERRLAASELAALYEWARYAPEPDGLSDQTLAKARRDLCFLAGVAVP
jgi:hypothetical protein